MRRIRILIAEMPRMLRDILEGAIGAQPDMELVAFREAADLTTAINRLQPDVVILAEDGSGLDVARLQLAPAASRLGVLMVTGSGREARLVEVRQIGVRSVSPQGFVETIRAEFAPHTNE